MTSQWKGLLVSLLAVFLAGTVVGWCAHAPQRDTGLERERDQLRADSTAMAKRDSVRADTVRLLQTRIKLGQATVRDLKQRLVSSPAMDSLHTGYEVQIDALSRVVAIRDTQLVETRGALARATDLMERYRKLQQPRVRIKPCIAAGLSTELRGAVLVGICVSR